MLIDELIELVKDLDELAAENRNAASQEVSSYYNGLCYGRALGCEYSAGQLQEIVERYIDKTL